MADDRNANVVISADVSGYTQGTQEAYNQTNVLIGAVDKLATSLDGITKRAGKKLMIFAAADMAALTGAVAVSANFEKQLQTLNAQAAITGKNINSYKLAINDAARAMPVARSEIVALTTQIAKLGVATPKTVEGLTNNFIKLGAATGESSSALAAGMIGLSRQMGTFAGGAKQMQNFSDSLVKVTASAGVSAQGVVEFSQAVAPFARAAGIGEKQLLGISTAFVKAGADGYSAANTMNQMLAEITRQVQTGSPDIAKYSNLIGVTIEQFKQMDPADRVVSIFEKLNQAGPDAIKMLDKLGFDGIRAAKAIQTVTSEAGGLRKYISESVGGYGSGATEKGAEAAFSGLSDTMVKIRNNIEQIAGSIGKGLLPVAEALANAFNGVLTTVNALAGPLLTVSGLLGGLVGAASGAGGLLMSGLGVAGQIALMATLVKATPMRSFFGGMGAGRYSAAHEGMAPPIGFNQSTDRYLGGRMPWYQRVPYRLGAGMGSFFPQAEGGQGFSLGRMLRMPLSIATTFANASADFYKQSSYWDSYRRTSSVGDALGRAGMTVLPMARGLAGIPGRLTDLLRGAPQAVPDLAGAPAPDASRRVNLPPPESVVSSRQLMGAAWRDMMKDPREALRGFREGLRAVGDSFKGVVRGSDEYTQAARVSTATAMSAAEASTTKSTADAKAAASAGGLAAALTKATIAANRSALSNIAQGAKGVVGKLGDEIAGLGILGGGMLAVTGFMAAKSAYDENVSHLSDVVEGYGVSGINTALGDATKAVTSFADAVAASTEKIKVTIEDAVEITATDRTRAQGREPADQALKNLGGPEQLAGYLQGKGVLSPEQIDQYALDALALGWDPAQVEAALKEYQRTTITPSGPGVAAPGLTQESLKEQIRANYQTEQQSTFLGIPTTAFSQFASEEQRGTNQSILESIATSAQAAAEISPEAGQQRWANLLVSGLGEAIDAMPRQFGTPMGYSSVQRNLVTDIFKELGAFRTDQERNDFESSPAFLQFMEQAGISYGTVESKSADELAQMVLDYITTEGQKNPDSMAGRMYTSIQQSGAVFTGNATTRSSAEQTAFATGSLSDVEKRIRGTALGEFARTNEQIYNATAITGSETGEPGAIARSMNILGEEAMRLGGSFSGAYSELEKMKTAVYDTSSDLYKLATATEDLLGSFEAVRQSEVGRAQGWRMQFEASQAKIEASKGGPEAPQIQIAETQKLLGTKTEIENFLRGWIQTARNFSIQMKRSAEDYQYSVDITNRNYYQQLAWQEADHYRSRKWAQEDFQRQMKYSEEDYLRSRLYAQQDYELQVKRANRDFNRQMAYSQEDYHRSRAREERNFNRQMRYMSEDMAKSIYDPWKRVSIGYTTSTRTLISNLQEQVRIFRRQTEELDQLREMGMSQQAIDVLGLGDPQKWAQVHRMIQTGTAEEIASINSLVAERGQVSDDLLMNPENNQALRRQLEERAQMLLDQEEDFRISVERSQLAFDTSMRDMAKNYATGTARQHEQYLIGLARSTDAYRLQMERDEILYRQGLERAQILHEQALKDMATQYEKAMRRAKKDLQRYGEEVTGGLNELYEKAIKWQKKLLGDETVAALDAIGGLKDSVLDALNELDGQHLTWTVDVSTNVSTGAGGYPSSTANPDYGGQGGYGHSAGYTGGGSGVAGNAGQTGQAGSVSSHTRATLAELEMWQVAVAKRMPDAYPSYVKKDKGKFYALTQGLGSQGPMWVTVPAQFFGSTSVWKDNWWKQYAYLAEGGVVTQPTNAVVGEGGPEAVVPLNEAGGDFIAKFIRQVAANLESDAPKSTDEEQLRVLKQSNQRLGAMLVLTDEANLFRKEFGADVTKGFEDLGKTTVEVGAKIVKALDKIPGEQPNKDPEGEGGNTPGITPGKPSKPAKPNTNKPPKPQSDTMTYDPYDPHDVTTYPGVSTSRMVSSISKTVVQELMTSGFATPVNGTLGAGGNVTINNNTTFTGITVQAQDPNAMARALKQKEKLANIRRGANAASAN